MFGSNQYRRTSYRKCDRARRSWSDREDVALIGALKELVAQGWKSDNGFRSGYQKKLEHWLKTDFPNTDLKVSPHITSKISAWKKNYYSLAQILERSGVGFNEQGDFRIHCDDDQWDQIVRQDKNARCMRWKSWPYWNDWKYIFGKDRASGGGAEGVSEADKNFVQEELAGDAEGYGDYHVFLDEILSDEPFHPTVAAEPGEGSTSRSQQENPPPKKCSRKRKGSDEGDGLLKLLSKLHAETNSRLDTLSSRIGYDMDLGKARKEIFRHLDNMPELSDAQKYDVCDIIGKENSRLEIFMGLPDAKKPGYVIRVMEKEHLI
ncbi:hypothetical protein SASPL_105484 [Salvia splendens]|uniref:Myb/SANT-like domain-containing protein n=2 Tax=Salvia splendens TaxID=180675 RepID=A0A8X8YPP5_SALSN|nr:hypothetical protein SASPL_105484 [Salvia splendens]